MSRGYTLAQATAPAVPPAASNKRLHLVAVTALSPEAERHQMTQLSALDCHLQAICQQHLGMQHSKANLVLTCKKQRSWAVLPTLSAARL